MKKKSVDLQKSNQALKMQEKWLLVNQILRLLQAFADKSFNNSKVVAHKIQSKNSFYAKMILSEAKKCFYQTFQKTHKLPKDTIPGSFYHKVIPSSPWGGNVDHQGH